MARTYALLAASTNILTLPLLADGTTGEAVSGATVLATLRDATGAEVVGQVWPVNLVEDATIAGRYSATIEPDLDVAADDALTCTITAQAGPTWRTFRLSVTVQNG
jgi:hypothetical protein